MKSNQEHLGLRFAWYTWFTNGPKEKNGQRIWRFPPPAKKEIHKIHTANMLRSLNSDPKKSLIRLTKIFLIIAMFNLARVLRNSCLLHYFGEGENKFGRRAWLNLWGSLAWVYMGQGCLSWWNSKNKVQHRGLSQSQCHQREVKMRPGGFRAGMSLWAWTDTLHGEMIGNENRDFQRILEDSKPSPSHFL